MPISTSIVGRNGISGLLSPALGAHGSDWDQEGPGTSPQTVSLTTRASGGSLIVVTLGRVANYAPPTDNKGNTLSLLRSSGYHGGLWSGYEMEVYGCASFAGGSSHATQFTKTNASEEGTLIVVEALRGATIQAHDIVTRAGAGDGVAYSSPSITTTGPALLVSCWSGDGGLDLDSQAAVPETGWQSVESLNLPATSYIQANCAVKYVPAAGTYSMTWAPVRSQGAIIFLGAIQA